MRKLLLTGHQKCGNTWCRFVIFNYWNIMENGSNKTLTYQDLINIDEAIWEGNDTYPQVYFTHVPKNRRVLQGRDWSKKGSIYKENPRIIYILRNPFDTMISYFHYLTNRNQPFNGMYNGKQLEELMTLNGFVRFFLPNYINHVKSTMPRANVIVKYELMRENPERFFNVLRLVFGRIDETIARKAIKLSSFDSIKQMGIQTGRTGGLASSFRDHFTRNGEVGQYKKVMSKELINYMKNECEKNGIKTL